MTELKITSELLWKLYIDPIEIYPDSDCGFSPFICVHLRSSADNYFCCFFE